MSVNDQEPGYLPCWHGSVSDRPQRCTGIGTCLSEKVPSGPWSQHLARALQSVRPVLCPRGTPRTADESKEKKAQIFTLRWSKNYSVLTSLYLNQTMSFHSCCENSTNAKRRFLERHTALARWNNVLYFPLGSQPTPGGRYNLLQFPWVGVEKSARRTQRESWQIIKRSDLSVL